MSTGDLLAIEDSDLRVLPPHLPLGRTDRLEVQQLIALNIDRGLTAHFDLMSADVGDYRATFEIKAATLHYAVHTCLACRSRKWRYVYPATGHSQARSLSVSRAPQYDGEVVEHCVGPRPCGECSSGFVFPIVWLSPGQAARPQNDP